MSYDVWFRHHNEDIGPAFNYTSNVGPMFLSAGKLHIKDLNGKTSAEAVAMLEPVVSYMETHPQEMQALAPDNGWGCFTGALEFVRDILDACAANPEYVVMADT
jgi:isopropylmalate/homocitrate/citramalate synthase